MDDSPNAGLRGLQDPVVIVAFGGWNDAGTAASSAIEHLADKILAPKERTALVFFNTP